MDNSLSGILYALGAFFLVAITHILVKALGDTLPLAEVMSFRFAIGLAFLYPAIHRQGGLRHILKTDNRPGMFYRAALGLAWIGMTFYALRYLPVAPATAIWASAPLSMAILSVPILKEHISFKQSLAIACGMIGVLLIAQPKSLGTDNTFAIAVMVLASFSTALANLQVRHMTKTNSSLTIVTWYFLIALIPCLLISLYHFVMPNPMQSLLLIGLGVSSSVMMIVFTQACRFLPAATVAVYEYTVILWTSLFGWLFFGEIFTSLGLAGACLIILGGVAMIRVKKAKS